MGQIQLNGHATDRTQKRAGLQQGVVGTGAVWWVARRGKAGGGGIVCEEGIKSYRFVCYWFGAEQWKYTKRYVNRHDALGPMKITALEEYGLRCLLRVAERHDAEPISAKEIAEMEALSLPYTQKLMRKLSDSGMVDAQRGPNGGYYLAEPLEAISLGDVMRELGGMLEIEDFCETHTGKKEVCAHACECTIKPVWSHVSEFLVATMDNIPLKVLIDDQDNVRRFLDEMRPAVAGGYGEPTEVSR